MAKSRSEPHGAWCTPVAQGWCRGQIQLMDLLPFCSLFPSIPDLAAAACGLGPVLWKWEGKGKGVHGPGPAQGQDSSTLSGQMSFTPLTLCKQKKPLVAFSEPLTC